MFYVGGTKEELEEFCEAIQLRCKKPDHCDEDTDVTNPCIKCILSIMGHATIEELKEHERMIVIG